MEVVLADAVSHMTCMLGTELGSCARAMCPLNHGAVSPPYNVFTNKMHAKLILLPSVLKENIL